MAGNLDLNIIARLQDRVTASAKKINTTLDKMQKHWLKVAAAVYSAKKAVDIVEWGAKIEEQRKAFDRLAQSYGADADFIIKKLKEISDNTLSTSEIIKSSSKALTLGIAPDKLAELMKISRAAAKAMGEDVSFMFESITMGIARQSKQILDNLGIVFSAEEAYERYAKQIGKSVSELTDFERRQAFANEVIRQGRNLVKKVGEDLATTNDVVKQLKATIKDYTESFSVFFSKVALLLILGVKGWQVFFLKVGSFFASFLAKIARYYFKFLNLMTKIPKVGKLFAPMAKEALKAAEKLSFAATKMKLEADKVWKSGEKIVFVLKSSSYSDAISKSKGAIDDLRDSIKGLGEDIDKIGSDGGDSFNALAEAAKSAASRIEGAFDDFFFNVFKGRIHGLRGLLTSLGDAILRMMSNLAATGFLKWTGISGLFTKISGGVAGAGSSIGIATVPTDGLYYLHRGEEVVPRYKKGGAGGGVSIVVNQVIQAWDANDVWRNRKVLAQGIAEEIRNNGQLRDIINRAR